MFLFYIFLRIFAFSVFTFLLIKEIKKRKEQLNIKCCELCMCILTAANKNNHILSVLLYSVHILQGWEFAHQFSERIARIFAKKSANERFAQ